MNGTGFWTTGRTAPRSQERARLRTASLRPMTATHAVTRGQLGRTMLNKVPEVTLFFWIIKILCTTVGETAADYLNENLGFGLTNTTYFTGALLAVLLLAQFRLRRYVPAVYWAAVVVISVFGTLITDNMTDGYSIPLTTSTPIFAVILAVVFGVWYAVERTLSIHTIVTTRREAFYWLAILFTFALGTAAGDLVAEQVSIGYAPPIALFGAMIAAVAIAWRLGANAVLSFWLAYILTRPLGASIGDELSQSRKDGALGLGTTVTSALFLSAIVIVVTYLAVTKRDVSVKPAAAPRPHAEVLVVAHDTAATPALVGAVRERAERSPASFHLLVPNVAEHAELTEAERLHRHADGERMLALALPLIEHAAHGAATGSVSFRHDPMDAIEEALHDGDFHEIILSTLPKGVSHWLHAELPERVAPLGLPVTTVVAKERSKVEPRKPPLRDVAR